MKERVGEVERMKFRLHKLVENGRNVDSPGVVNKLRRQIRRKENS